MEKSSSGSGLRCFAQQHTRGDRAYGSPSGQHGFSRHSILSQTRHERGRHAQPGPDWAANGQSAVFRSPATEPPLLSKRAHGTRASLETPPPSPAGGACSRTRIQPLQPSRYIGNCAEDSLARWSFPVASSFS